MKKEKELAERRKNDPPLDLANDHPVRKLISRFRKISDAKHEYKNQSSYDIERGGVASSNHNDENSSTQEHPKTGTRVIKVCERTNSVLHKSIPRIGSDTSLWTKSFGGITSENAATDSVSDFKGGGIVDKAIPLNDLSHKTESRSSEAPKISTKPMSKWGRLLAKQEPIQESSEDELRSNPQKIMDPSFSGALFGNNKRDQRRAVMAEERDHRSLPATLNINNNKKISSSNNETVQSSRSSMAATVTSSLSAAEQHVLSSLYDIRLEIKEEIDSLKQKMDLIDEHIVQVLHLFSPNPTPFSSIATRSSSKQTSTRSATIASGFDQSPKSSLSSSSGHEQNMGEPKLTTGIFNISIEAGAEDLPQTILRRRSSPPAKSLPSHEPKPSSVTAGGNKTRCTSPSKSSNSSNESQNQSSDTQEPGTSRCHGHTTGDVPEVDEVTFVHDYDNDNDISQQK